MNMLKTPLEATIYPDYNGNEKFFKTLKTRQEIDFAHNLILLSRKNENMWITRIDSSSYIKDCKIHNIFFEDSHTLCFEKLEEAGYLEEIENTQAYKITDKFKIEAPTLKHEHPSSH